MRRTATFLVVLALLALVPLRALASVTIGFCAVADPVVAAQAQADHDHGAQPHGGASAPEPNADCNSCVEHCTSAVLLPALPGPLAGSFGTERAVLPAYFAAGHVPEHLDPPPLAL